MSRAPEPAPILTDHAVLRYAERVLGVAVREAVEERLLADARRVSLIRAMRHGRIRMGDSDIHLVVEEGRVVTVVIEQPETARHRRDPKLEHS